MNVVWGAITVVVGLLGLALAEMISEEVRSRLDSLPRAMLWLAARRIPDHARNDLLRDWQGELHTFLRGAEARPVTRLVRGLKYAAGLFWVARRVAYEAGYTPQRVGLFYAVKGVTGRRWVPPACGIASVVGIWCVAGALGAEKIIPSPFEVAGVFVHRPGHLMQDVSSTTVIALTGLLAAVAAAPLAAVIWAVMRIFLPDTRSRAYGLVATALLLPLTVVYALHFEQALGGELLALMFSSVLSFAPILSAVLNGPRGVLPFAGMGTSSLETVLDPQAEGSPRKPPPTPSNSVLIVRRVLYGCKTAAPMAVFGATIAEALFGERGIGALAVRASGLLRCPSPSPGYSGFCGRDHGLVDMPLILAAWLVAAGLVGGLVYVVNIVERRVRRRYSA